MNLEKEIQQIRNERCIELFNKPEDTLQVAEIEMLNKYIDDYNKPRIWKPVQIMDIITEYEVNNFGEVRNKFTNTILNPHKNEFGYLKYSIRYNGWGKTVKAHRLVAQAFIPNPENKCEVNHISCVKTCNWVGNLEWVTSAENKQHARAHGLYHEVHGQDKKNAKYTDEQIHQVCKYLQDGKHPLEISKIMGIPVSCPKTIKYCGRWKHISSQYEIPASGEIPRVDTTKISNNAKYSEEIIHTICKMLSSGSTNADISVKLNVPDSMVSLIRNKKMWKYISKQYTFPDIKDKFDPRVKHRDEIIKMLKDGETDFGVILKKIDIPDSRASRKYIAGIKHSMKK